MQFVNLIKLFAFGLGRTGHTGKFFVEAEIVLERNRGQCHRLFLNGDAFFGFDGLVETFVIATTLQ